ncbi:hypothetical protein JCM8547_005692 [Rhodosporidiobolus lusitaniae]
MPGLQQDILLATMPDVRPLASLLRSLSFRHQATVKIDSQGLRFTVEEGRGLQAHAYMTSDSFSSYQLSLSPSDPAAISDEPPRSRSPSPSADDDEQGQERRNEALYCHTSISLSTLLECLNIFGNAGLVAAPSSSSSRFKRDRSVREDTFADDGGGYGGGGRRRQGGGGDHYPQEEERAGPKEKTSLRISYKGLGEPLVLLLEESGIVTRCELTTYEPDGLLDLAFPNDERVVRLIMKSEWLRDALLELPPSSEKLSISFAPPHLVSRARGGGQAGRYRREGTEMDVDDRQEEEEEVPLFRLESTGTLGSTEMDYSDDRDVLEVFECDQPVRNTYRFSHIQLTKSALGASTKTSIRTAPSGLVSFQFMVPLGSQKPVRGGSGGEAGKEQKVGFVEFLCVALDDDY